MTLAERTMTAAIAATVKTNAAPAPENAPDAAAANKKIFYRKGDINANEYYLPRSGTFRCGKIP